jgi:hypothetical protein
MQEAQASLLALVGADATIRRIVVSQKHVRLEHAFTFARLEPVGLDGIGAIATTPGADLALPAADRIGFSVKPPGTPANDIFRAPGREWSCRTWHT